MEERIYEGIARDFAKRDVTYVGENGNAVLYQAVVDDDGMAMFVSISKDTLKPVWTNGMDDPDFVGIMSVLPEDEDGGEDPYFMSDDSWWMFDGDGKIVLTSKAPPEAVDSYFEWKNGA